MTVKRYMYRASLFVPIMAVCYLFWNPFSIYIGEVNPDLWYRLLPFCFLIFTMLWLNFSPYRKGCKDGWMFELLFNLFPVEVLLTLVFAQYHFVLTVILLGLVLATSILFRISINKTEREKRTNYKTHKRNMTIKRRFFVLLTTVVFFIPSTLAVFVYNLQDPYYEASMDLLSELFAVDEVNTDTFEDAGDNVGFIDCFKMPIWTSFSPDKKITVLQLLADYESIRLGMPAVPISSKRIDMFTLGEYSPTYNTICIDLEHLEDSPPEDTIRSLLHEVFHAYQHYVITNIDWESDFSNSAFFEEARNWKNNNENYINGITNYEDYASQPLEASAREFAEIEGTRLLRFISEGEG